MVGFVPLGEIEALGDVTTGAAIDRPLSHSQSAVDRRLSTQVKPLVSAALADDPTLTAAGLAAVDAAIAGKSLVEGSKGELENGTDFNSLQLISQVGSYTVAGSNSYLNAPLDGAPGVLELWRGNLIASAIQRFSTGSRMFWRKATGNGEWGQWNEVSTAANRILELAKSDGWHALYDPTDTAHTITNAAGRLVRIEDALGNLPALASSGADISVIPSAFGELSGFSGGSIGMTLSEPITDPFTILIVATQTTGPTGQNRHLIGGDSISGRVRLYAGTTDRLSMGAGSLVAGERWQGDMIIDATWNGEGSNSHVGGQLNTAAIPGLTSHQLSLIRVGGLALSSPQLWGGTIGTMLIYRGEIPQEKLNRMRNLLATLTGIPTPKPPLADGTRVYSIDGAGQEAFVQGDPDALTPHGIASMTKMLTAVTARKFLTTEALLDGTVTLLEEDFWSLSDTDRFQPGDIVSYRDLLYAMALPSDNTAPRAVARVLGGNLPGTKPAVDRFLDEMNTTLAELGAVGATSGQTTGSTTMSPKQVAELVLMLRADPVLKDIFGTLHHDMEITGPTPRSEPLESTLIDTSYPIPAYVLGKTGTGSIYRHVAVVCALGGVEHVIVVMDTPNSVNRFHELRVAVESILAGYTHRDYSTRQQSGLSEQTTFVRDVTDYFGAIRAGDNSGIYLSRVGLDVTLTLATVSLPENVTLTGILPEGWRPSHPWSYGVVRASSGDEYEVRVSSAGTVSIIGNPADAVLRGTIMWKVSPMDPMPGLPYPGEFLRI